MSHQINLASDEEVEDEVLPEDGDGEEGEVGDEEEEEDADTSPVAILEETEKKVIRLLHIASDFTDQLAVLDPISTQKSLTTLAADYVSTCETIRITLLDQISNLMENNPYKSTVSAYGAKKDTEIAHQKTVLLLELMNDLKNDLPPEGL